jgi:hypothetical protein
MSFSEVYLTTILFQINGKDTGNKNADSIIVPRQVINLEKDRRTAQVNNRILKSSQSVVALDNINNDSSQRKIQPVKVNSLAKVDRKLVSVGKKQRALDKVLLFTLSSF